MKKENFIYVVLLGLLVSSMNISCNSVNAEAGLYPSILERKDTAGIANEFNYIQESYLKYKKALQKDSLDYKSRIKLVELYINESRITGNLSYYNDAAMRLLDGIIVHNNTQPDILYQALAYKATILLSLHQFVEAKKIAEQALLLNPYEADIYGALTDANVECGHYEEAVKMCDKMMSIRPDIRSYSRSSYMRQIYGDNQGAIAAMRMAVESGAQGMENTEWARVQLGDLYLNTGHADTAKMLYESSLYARPNYPFAEMGLAKVASSLQQYDTAIVHCKHAIRVMSESSFVSFLGDLYKKKGDLAKADEIHSDVLKLLLDGMKENNGFAKHNGNRELANAYLNAKQFDKALDYAKKDVEMRPSNIDANELLAWIYFVRNEPALSKIHIEKALSTNSQNANLIYKASLIYKSLGEESKSIVLESKAYSINRFLKPENFVAINK